MYLAENPKLGFGIQTLIHGMRIGRKRIGHLPWGAFFPVAFLDKVVFIGKFVFACN